MCLSGGGAPSNPDTGASPHPISRLFRRDITGIKPSLSGWTCLVIPVFTSDVLNCVLWWRPSCFLESRRLWFRWYDGCWWNDVGTDADVGAFITLFDCVWASASSIVDCEVVSLAEAASSSFCIPLFPPLLSSWIEGRPLISASVKERCLDSFKSNTSTAIDDRASLAVQNFSPEH